MNSTGVLVAEGPINKQIQLSNGIQFWTGTALDLFQGNAKGIGAFKNQASKGLYDLSTFDIGEAGNVFASLSSSVIVLEVPNEMLPPTIYYYATTALPIEPDHWHRVNRIGYVLFPHLYLLDQDKMGTYIEANHEIDPDLKKAIYSNVLHYTTIAGYQTNAEQYADSMINNIYPDVVPYKVGTPAVYAVQQINGRSLYDDAMDVALALLVGSPEPIDDKVSVKPERFQKEFPFVVPIDDAYNQATDKTVYIKVAKEKQKKRK